jgi:hypothetical protein
MARNLDNILSIASDHSYITLEEQYGIYIPENTIPQHAPVTDMRETSVSDHSYITFEEIYGHFTQGPHNL